MVREYRYAMYNRPVWGGLSLSQPYTLDFELTHPDVVENRKYYNRDAHSILVTTQPLTADEIRNLELVDITADNKQRAHKTKLVEYVNALDGVSDSGKRALVDMVKSGKYVKNKADVDKWADKLRSQDKRAEQRAAAARRTAAPTPKKPAATMKQATNCVYRVDEFQQIAQAWWTSSTIPLQNSLDAAKKLVAKATKKRQRQIDKANRDWRPNAWGADPEHGPRRIVKICNGKEVEYYPATKADEERAVESKAIYQRVGADVPGATPAAPKHKKQPAKPKRKPAPDLPPILTAPPELAADVLGTGPMGMTPTAAPKPKRKPKKTAAKPAKKPPAATPKPKTKATKPKAKKTAAAPKLTASQREYLAINGFVRVKRGGKYVRITG